MATIGDSNTQTGVEYIGDSSSTVTPVVSSTATSSGSEFTPQAIMDIYNVLAPMSTDYANANIERIGQAQSSYGPLAEAAMGDSRTAGIGNYTYNRLVRPSVDSMRDQLVVEGLSSSLNQQISNSLKKAKDNYQRAYKSYARRYGSGGTGGGTKPTTNTPGTGQTSIDGYDDVDSGSGSQRQPMVLYNEYTITDTDGKSITIRRPEIMKSDLEWYNWAERQRKKAEADGKTFKYGSK